MIVAPYAGAWIETCPIAIRTGPNDTSPPTRGAWIETSLDSYSAIPGEVAPYAGAWIETWNTARSTYSGASPPTRGRGHCKVN